MSEAMTDPAHDFIAKTIQDHQVVLFMKGEPEQPRCGFSAVVVQILDHQGERRLVCWLALDDDEMGAAAQLEN